MLRGYRLAFCAAFGWLIAAAASPGGHRSETEETKTQQQISHSLERIASALDEANKPKREAKDCAEGANDRKSDLCAQWKAADAARASAISADQTVTISVIGLILGAVTMGAAIAAAIFAKVAADHTRRGADVAVKLQRYSIYENKPWLFLHYTDSNMYPKISNDLFTSYLQVRNTGKTRAEHVILKMELRRGGSAINLNYGVITGHPFRIEQEKTYGISVEHPINEIRQALGDDFEAMGEDWEIVASLSYKDAFGDNWDSVEVFGVRNGSPVPLEGGHQKSIN